MQRFDASSPMCSGRTGCALVLTDDWDMNDEKRHLNEAVAKHRETNWLRTRCESHTSQLQDENYFWHEHVPRDQNLGNELNDDLLMNEACANVRVDAERVETDPIIEPGRCVCVRSEIRWLANSRFISEEVSKVGHIGKRRSEDSTSDCGTELVTAVLRGLKQQLQGDG